MNNLHLRAATVEDLAAINDIYNHYVLNSTCTYQELPERLEDRRSWFERHSAALPVIVAVQGETIAGWGSLSPYHTRSAYRFTVENSVYVRPECHRQGVGSALLERLIELGESACYRTIIAGIDSDQPASIALHAKFGFVRCGIVKSVGFKFGRWLDVVYMQRMLST